MADYRFSLGLKSGCNNEMAVFNRLVEVVVSKGSTVLLRLPNKIMPNMFHNLNMYNWDLLC